MSLKDLASKAAKLFSDFGSRNVANPNAAQNTLQSIKQYAATPAPKYSDFANLGPVRQQLGYASAMGAFGPLPQVARQVTQAFPKTTLPVSHYFAGSSLLPVEDIALGQRLPEKEKYANARLAGAATSALITGGPKLLLKSAFTGAGLGTVFQAGKNIYNKEPILKDVGKSAIESGKYGVQTAQTMQLTNGLVNSLAKFVPFLNPLTEKGIEKTLPGVQMTLNQAVKKIGTTLFKRVVKAALIETPIEGITYGISQREEGQKLIDSIANQTVQNFVFNVGSAGVNTLWDSRVVAPILKRSVDQAIDQYKALPLEVRSGGGGDINAKIGVSPTTKTPIGESGGVITPPQGVGGGGGVKIKTTGENQLTSQSTSQQPIPQPQVQTNQIVPEVKPGVPSVTSSSTYFNTDRLNVNTKAKDFVTKTIEEVKPQIEKVAGKKLSNKEAVNLANNSAKVLNKVVSKQETLAWEAKLLKARELLAKQANDGVVTQEYIDNLLAVKTQGTDIARKLQSMSIGADPKEVTAKQAILEAVLKVTQDTDAVLAKAKGVDFNNYEQAASFYRQFVKPTAGDWMEKIRYSSMLSSPNTHVNNFSSNFQGTGIIAPIEKTISGGVDALLSALNPNRPRTQFAGEGIAYAKGYYSKVGKAYGNFLDVMRGNKVSSMQEMYSLPLTEAGTKARKVENTLSFFPKLLQAGDEFFQTLTESGVTSSLKYRVSKGVKVTDIAGTASLEGRKRLFNAAFGLKEEGYVLKAVEFIPQKVGEARMSKNPVISTIAKYSYPFVRIPSNILKASVEYGPLGVATLPGASNKVEQISKAILGTTIGIATATLVGEDRLTWAEPTDEKKRNAARAAGWQPYSLKVGNTYLSYAKMHPAIAFPMALVAAVRDAQKRKLLDDGQVETVMNGVAKWVNFYASMSYVKNVGDMVAGVQGDLSAGTRQVGNYVQQLVPFRALMGWITRIVDKDQRQVDPKGNILEKQLQYLMTQIPGLSGQVPARVDSKGNPAENQHRLINAFSPIKISTENPVLMRNYNFLEATAQATRQETAIKQQVLETGKEQTYNGKKFYLSKELDSKTGEYKPVVKSIKVAQSTSDVYAGLDKQYDTSSDSPKNFIEKMVVYGTGIFKDPEGTINAVKTGQPIRKVRGDAVVVERLIGLDKIDQGEQTTQVDHIIAVALGGTNDESNLAIISKQDNQAKGIVDTYLANELEAGRITKKIAQERDLNWRSEINTLPAIDKAKALAILNTAPVKQEVAKVDTGILNTLSTRVYEPIYNEATQTYSDVQVKIPVMGELTGFAEIDKQTKSKYTSALSTAKTNIGKLYLDGQITAQEANDALLTMKAKSASAKTSSKTGSAKKVTAKKITMPKFTIAKSKTSKIKIKAMPKPKKITASKNTMTTKKGVVYKIKTPKKITLKVSNKGSIV